MNIKAEKEQLIKCNHSSLQYCGRIDFIDEENPLFIYPCSSVHMRCSGTSFRAVVTNYHAYRTNYIGVIIDGKERSIQLQQDKEMTVVVLAEYLKDEVHDVILFKRMDGCHYFKLHGFLVDKMAIMEPPQDKPHKKIEFFGDSVSAGEFSEAIGYEGKADPEHNGEYSNSWYSYASITARKLNAQIHNTSQGGIALMDGMGYFCAPNTIGIRSSYDKLCYNPELGEITPWDFSKYIPHIVVVAIGQNDSYPEDIMSETRYEEKAKEWKKQYSEFIMELRNIYPQSLIILTTTIMKHNANWDKAIEEVCVALQDEKVVHFMYQNNGHQTIGHVRKSEAEQMAKELVAYINSFGNHIWSPQM